MKMMILSAFAALSLCLTTASPARAQYAYYYPNTAYLYNYYTPGYASYYPYSTFYSYPTYSYSAYGYYPGYSAYSYYYPSYSGYYSYYPSRAYARPGLGRWWW